MQKKSTIISLLFIFAIVLSAIAYIVFSGITAKDYNYVQLEINPRVEFVCDKFFNVISVSPLNEEAGIILAGLDYIGMDVDEASVDFVDQCAQAGYIDVNGSDNAVNITVIDGITQALDVHVTKSIYDYLRKKEIMCAVIENYEDRSMFDEKKENNVCCSNKYKLIKTIQEKNPTIEIDKLKKLSEENLIDMVANYHSSEPYSPTEEQIILKSKLIEFNRQKYEKHMKSITPSSQKEFSEIFDDFQKQSIQKYSNNFNKEYANWQNKHIS